MYHQLRHLLPSVADLEGALQCLAQERVVGNPFTPAPFPTSLWSNARGFHRSDRRSSAQTTTNNALSVCRIRDFHLDFELIINSSRVLVRLPRLPDRKYLRLLPHNLGIAAHIETQPSSQFAATSTAVWVAGDYCVQIYNTNKTKRRPDYFLSHFT